MQQQTIVKKPSWWKQRSALKRGLVVIVLSGILLCSALTVVIVVIVTISGSCHTGDCAAGTSEPETLPVKAEALSLRYFWLKRHKMIRTTTRTSDERLATNSPVRNRTPTNTSVEQLATTSPVRNRTPTNKPKRDVCDTDECRLDASIISKKMDSTVDPCDNFYRYVCGGFMKSTRVPKYKQSVTSLTAIGDETTKRLRTIFEAESEPNEGKPSRLVKNLYKSCMDTSAIEARGLEPLRAILREFGGWPVLDGASWNDSDFDYIRSIYKFRDAGYSADYFINLRVEPDVFNSTRRLIRMRKPDLAVEEKHLLKGFDDRIVSAYYNYMVEIASILGADRNRAKAELKESLLFEMKLANIGSMPSPLPHTWTFTELQKIYPTVLWKEYVKRLFPPTAVVNEHSHVRVVNPYILVQLEMLMSQTPKRVQANYLMWRAVAASVLYLNEPIRKKQLEYLAGQGGPTDREARWMECVDIVSSSLPISVNAIYAKKYLNKDVKEGAVEVVMNIRKALKRMLQTYSVFDGRPKQKALEKIDAMTSVVGYLDEFLHEHKLEEFYKNVDVSEDNFFENIFYLKRFDTDMSFGKLRKSVKKTDWLTEGEIPKANEPNAYYSRMHNVIHIPAQMLQGDFFRNDRPKYMNYGAIGRVIGHEMLYGFDNNGQVFCNNGSVVIWWTASTEAKFSRRAQCISDQYSSYTLRLKYYDTGVSSLNDNVPDNGGIKVAYRAYNSWVARNGEEKKLPGFSWTPKQLFWISYANTACGVIAPESLKHSATTFPLADPEFRVVGALSNIAEFAEDFKCPEGSKMNRKHKCPVW